MQRNIDAFEVMIAQLASYKMNVKPDPNIARKLKEKLTAATKNGGNSSEAISLRAQLDDEQHKLTAYEESRQKFKEELVAFFKSLPYNDPQNAFKQLHLCSLTLFMQCQNLDSVLPYTDLSFHQQRCQIFEDVLKEYIEDQVKNAASNDNYKPSHDLCQFWVDVYSRTADAKDTPMAKGIDGAISTFNYSFTQKSKSGVYFTSKLHEQFEKIRTKQTAKMIAYATKDQEEVKPTPPSCSLFSQIYERDIKAELETHKSVFECLDTLMKNIKASLIDEKMLADIIVKLKSADKSTINWEKFATDNFPDFIAAIQKKLVGDQKTVGEEAKAIVVNCIEALRAVAIEKLDKNQIEKNSGIVGSLEIIHQNKQKLMSEINTKKQNITKTIEQYQTLAKLEFYQTKLIQPDKFNPEYKSQKSELDAISITTNLQERKARLTKFAEDNAAILAKRHKVGSTSGYIENYYTMLRDETDALLQQAKVQRSPEWSRVTATKRDESVQIGIGRKSSNSEPPEIVRDIADKPFTVREKFERRKAMVLGKGSQDASPPPSPSIDNRSEQSIPVKVPSSGNRSQPETPKASSAPDRMETGAPGPRAMIVPPSALLESSLFNSRKVKSGETQPDSSLKKSGDADEQQNTGEQSLKIK